MRDCFSRVSTMIGIFGLGHLILPDVVGEFENMLFIGFICLIRNILSFFCNGDILIFYRRRGGVTFSILLCGCGRVLLLLVL